MAIHCPKCKFANTSNSKFCKECGTQLISIGDFSVTKTIDTPVKGLTRGTTFAGRYEIIEELGTGGMGRVYRVLDKKIEEEIAIKVLKADIASDKKIIERFKNEIRIARNIGHRSVCRMYDLNEENGTAYITMEYVPGEDLKSFIRRSKRLDSETAIAIAKQISEGLSEAHRLGVVHRDLKSNNIMIDKEGNARIMDFGIARSVKAKSLTEEGIIGTPEYMSPEQVEAKEIDPQSDIYSLGVMLYEMVTGRLPFEGGTPLSIAMKLKAEKPIGPKALNPQIPHLLNQLILKCLEKDKENRYASASQLVTELTSIEQTIPTSKRAKNKKRPFTFKEITASFPYKKIAIPVIAYVALVVIALVLWHPSTKKTAETGLTSKPSIAIMYFKNNTGIEELDIWRSALADSLITDLSQSKYLRILSEDRMFQILTDLNQLDAQNYSSHVLEEVAAKGKVTHIIQGSYAKAGETFRIDITIQDSGTGEILGSDRVEGEGESSFFSMVDELTRNIKTKFNLSTKDISSDIDRQAARITTKSPEAYKVYIEGLKYYQKREFHESLMLMEKAIAIDPEFAMAYKTMAFSYLRLGDDLEMRRYLKKAFTLKDRISERDGYEIQVTYYWVSERDYPKAIDTCKRLLELYPDDRWANSQIGSLYSDIEEWNKAIERFKILIQIDPESAQGYTMLASSYLALGLHEKVQEALNGYLENYPDNGSIHYYMILNYISQLKFDFAKTELEKFALLSPGAYRSKILSGDLAYFQDRFIDAEKEYQNLLDTDDWLQKAYGQDRMASLALTLGKYENSKRILNQGIEHAKKNPTWTSFYHALQGYLNLKTGNYEQALTDTGTGRKTAVEGRNRFASRFALYVKCRAFLAMNSMNDAKKVEKELKEEIDRGFTRKAIRFHFLLLGLIRLKEKDYSKAVQNLEKAIPLLPGPQYISEVYNDHALFFEPLGLAYLRSGDLNRARNQYEAITKLTYGRLYYSDIYAKAFYMLGKIHEKQNNTPKAIENYEKFLALWKDADPGLPEVDDARLKLTKLKGRN
jgi:serine/threonine protein kinase/Tfp pilus assembly protein PilF